MSVDTAEPAAVSPAVLTMKQAAAYVGMSYDRFKRAYHQIPHIQRTRPNGRVFFEREDLDAWLRIGKRRPQQPA